MINDAFGANVAGVALAALTSDAAHAATPAAAVKHRVATATDTSVDRGNT